MSHLPPATVEVLTAFVQELDGRVQADLHSVDRARRQHEESTSKTTDMRCVNAAVAGEKPPPGC